jgi:hypothetical protein
MLLTPDTGTQWIALDRYQLALTLENIWSACFPDIPRVNTVEIAYGYPWKRRLGLIRLSLDNTRTFIGVNALLQRPEAPEYVLLTTIAHELVHYAHGFGSPLPRLFKHPHANGVVELELKQRGLGELARKCDEWIDNTWFAFYDMQQKARPVLKAIPSTKD